MARFKKLDVPHQWKDEFTKYPHGYSIFEAISKWVDQLNRMVTNINKWNEYLGGFTSSFADEVTGLGNTLLSHLAESAAKHTGDLVDTPNGSYVKYDNGLVDIWHSFSVDLSGKDTWSSQDYVWEFPIPVIAGTFNVVGMARGSGGLNGNVNVTFLSGAVNATTSTTIRVTLMNTTTTQENVQVFLQAKGRWKEAD